MTTEERIRYHLAFLYGEENTQQIWSELCSILDNFQTPVQPSLKTLQEFVNTYLCNSVSGIHILPFYPYSSDDGFSVIDFRRVNSVLGDWEDLADLGKLYRLMFDAVINHVSRESNWFQSYLRDEESYRNYFITPTDDWNLSNVVRPRTHPLLTEVETPKGRRRVWATFSDDQIDLNYANSQVLLGVISLLLFYVEKGASILRLDAIAYLWKESGTPCIHLPQTHAVIKILRAVLDLVASEVLLITETNVPHEKISVILAID
jgi:sucrose phosphorylase